MASVDYFQQYDENTTQECLKKMSYVYHPKNSIVFEIGKWFNLDSPFTIKDSVGTNFWVILEGSVGVNVWTTFKNSAGYEDRRLEEVRILSHGSSFGELALLENKPRAATIRCKEACYFAVLEKEEFQSILCTGFNKYISSSFLNSTKRSRKIGSWTQFSSLCSFIQRLDT